ncbi:hypothetical protein NKW55_11835 [Gluconobacter kondonii]|uniref:Peptidase C39-like domain-containing protein n=1 Tax=Gluconobacter kondonii TaxID=941463 RepID=A0ABQ5WSP1_9PROT|nr:hypothetical protein [Gluconobacter kondonii]MCP1237290.1 hypothetical protein [Gluconobacter kondonii]GBR30081.1 hypothetical protein AA3266_0356 [Gluconobacter kondonii NBRC 3266]GLQ66566.1 hypothetical protein GCM10007870_21500 [Gluconobacter kondonii]
MSRCLGKRTPRHDPRTYRLAPMLASRLPGVPTQKDWSAGVPYQMWGNDRYGCCAFAAQAALTATWTNAAQALVVMPTSMVLNNYAAVTGFDPQTGARDNGTVLLDELNFWLREGLHRPGQTLDYLTAYGTIDPQDCDSIRRGICYLGGVLAGVQVPQGFMDLPLGTTWDWNAISNKTPVGGHAIALVGYDPKGLFFNTWGTRTFMPWDTFTKIADEAYGLLSRQNWVSIPGTSPNGETFDTLLAEVRGL